MTRITPFQESQLIATLLKSPLLKDVSLAALRDLLRVAAHKAVKAGEVIHSQDDGPLRTGLLVLSGELRVEAAEGYTVGMATKEGIGGAAPSLSLVRGDSFGETCLLTGEIWRGSITAERRSEVLLLSEAEFELLLDHSPSLRRAVGQRPEALVMAVTCPRRFPEVPISILTELLATAIEASFPEQVLVIRLIGRGDDPLPTPDPTCLERDGGADRVELSVGSVARVEEALASYGVDYDYIFVDATGCPSPLRAQIERRHHRLVLTFDPQEAGAILPAATSGESEVMYTLLLNQMGGVYPQGVVAPEAQDIAGFSVFEARTGAKSRSVSSHALGRNSGGDGDADGPRGDSAGEPLKESCRLRVDLRTLTRQWADGMPSERCTRAYRANKEELDRWARFITQRTVGLALGGGGAWGYIHVALIQLLLDKGVPVDMVSGTSFGSLVGAYYCTLGRAGLDLLVERGLYLQAASVISVFTTRGLQLLVDRDLAAARLETIRLPFYPVTTNLTTTQGVALARGPVSLGVRASSSAPGLFAPTQILGMAPAAGRFVDGVVVNNVPVNALLKKGADLVVGSNVYPAPSGRPLAGTGTLSRLRDLSLGRFADASTSLNLALHAVGDWQAAMANVTYDASHSIMGMSPDLGAARFGLSAQILEKALEDPHLHDVAQDVSQRWVRLRDQRPR